MTTGRPATCPANVTSPGAAARTSAPAAAARSTPRCPAPHGRAGGSKRPIMAPGPPSGPSTGHHRPFPPTPLTPLTPGAPGAPGTVAPGPASPATPTAAAPSALPAACPSAPGQPPVSSATSTTGTTSGTRRPAAALVSARLPLPPGAALASTPALAVTPAPAPTPTPTTPTTPTPTAMPPRLPGPARPGHPGPVSCGQPAPGDNGHPSNGWTPAGARHPGTAARVPRTWPVPARPPSAESLGARRFPYTSHATRSAGSTSHAPPPVVGLRLSRRPRQVRVPLGPPSPTGPRTAGESGSARSGRQAWLSPDRHGQNRA